MSENAADNQGRWVRSFCLTQIVAGKAQMSLGCGAARQVVGSYFQDMYWNPSGIYYEPQF